MTFAAIPIKRLDNEKLLCEFVEPSIPPGGFVLGHVGTYKECCAWVGMTMQDWARTKELIGFSSSPSFLWAMCQALQDFSHTSFANRSLFGYPHDIIDENIDVIWIKMHFVDKPEVTS